jgi:hypothetical protein
MTVNWCGETWDLPGDSGTEFEVLPTVYGYSDLGTLLHQWNNNDELLIKRSFAEGSTRENLIEIYLDDQDATRSDSVFQTWDDIGEVWTPDPPHDFTDMDIITNTDPVMPTDLDYAITSNMLTGSYEEAGVTRSYRIGNRWS